MKKYFKNPIIETREIYETKLGGSELDALLSEIPITEQPILLIDSSLTVFDGYEVSLSGKVIQPGDFKPDHTEEYYVTMIKSDIGQTKIKIYNTY